MAARRLRLPLDPYLLALLATVALAFLLPARGGARTVLNGATYAAVAGLFFLYGAKLSPRAVWTGLTHWRLQALVFASTYVLFPLIGLAIGVLARPLLPADIVAGLVFLCLLPSTVQSSIAFTSIARGNVAAALCSASLSNMAGVVVTPLLVSLILPTSGGLSLSSLSDIGLQILLPFALGQMLRPWIGAGLGRHARITGLMDRGSILLIVYAAFGAGVVGGVWKRVSGHTLILILVFDLLILAVVIALTTWASRRVRASTEDEIAIVFCGSKKSMASGIPMANILFAGHAVGLVVLPLMIFHQAQLFVCATLARRYAARPRVEDALAGSRLGVGGQ
uniref:Bile acid:sodium symporter n=1 Tax=Caulobacter sp. (strain K31) TaxID=366602 RepID=B0T6P2_CAUSK